MIIEFLLTPFFLIARLFIGVLPTFPSFEGLNASLAPLFYVLQTINGLISLQLFGICLMLVLVVYNIKFVWSMLMWLIRKIPGVS